jgi:glycosyltransferase involved in cell wall biosynthesis
MQKLSVAIIAKNEAARIAACLESVRGLADDVVVVISDSTDDTATLCRAHGARVIEAQWHGFGSQKNLAVKESRYDWVLCVDADEQVTPQLAASIRQALDAPSAAGFRLRRRNKFMGRYLRHGEGYPDWNLRLFDRRRGSWSNDEVHERVQVDGIISSLAGDLRHDSADTLERYLLKQNRYTSLAAEQALRQHTRVSAAHLIISPVTRFIKFYVFRLGFLDGIPGLVHITVGCFSSLLKYAKIREAQASSARGEPPHED